MFGAKAQIAALEKRASFELAMVPYTTERGYQPKHADVLRINPKGQVPVLIDGSVEIYDSTQIFEYLEDRYPTPALWPAEPAQRAAARKLEHASDEVFFVQVIKLMRRSASSPETRREARANIAEYYRQMDAMVSRGEFLAGASFGYADIAFYMAQLFAAFLGASMTDDTPKLMQWRLRMTERSAVAAVAAPMARFMAANGIEVPEFLQAIAQERGGASMHPRT